MQDAQWCMGEGSFSEVSNEVRDRYRDEDSSVQPSFRQWAFLATLAISEVDSSCLRASVALLCPLQHHDCAVILGFAMPGKQLNGSHSLAECILGAQAIFYAA